MSSQQVEIDQKKKSELEGSMIAEAKGYQNYGLGSVFYGFDFFDPMDLEPDFGSFTRDHESGLYLHSPTASKIRNERSISYVIPSPAELMYDFHLITLGTDRELTIHQHELLEGILTDKTRQSISKEILNENPAYPTKGIPGLDTERLLSGLFEKNYHTVPDIQKPLEYTCND